VTKEHIVFTCRRCGKVIQIKDADTFSKAYQGQHYCLSCQEHLIEEKKAKEQQ